MTTKTSATLKSATTLRERAEAMLHASRTDIANMSAIDVQQLVHELQVHQVELELQNEDLRQAQIDLAHSRDLYADLYEFAPVGFLSLNSHGEILEANLTAAAMLGVERKQLKGCKFADFLPGEAQDTWHFYRRDVFANTTKIVCELPVCWDDNRPQSIRLESIVMHDGDCEVRRCRMAMIDVSDRKSAEDALRELNIDLKQSLSHSESELRHSILQVRLLTEAVSHLGEGVMITDTELDWPGPHIVFVNEALCRVTGYDASELVGLSPRILQGSGTDRETLARLRASLSASRPVSAEVTNYRKDGTPYIAELFITPLFDDEGRCINFVAIHRDITKRKQTQAELQEREQQLNAILDTAADAILNLDRQGNIINANVATEQMFGYAMKELMAMRVMDLLPSLCREQQNHDLAQILNVERESIAGRRMEIVGHRKDGSTLPIDLAASEIDHLGIFTFILRDIAERKNSEEILRREHAFIESLISTARHIVLVLDAEGRIFRFNQYFATLTGWRLDEVQGQDWFETFLPEYHRKQSRGLFHRVIRGETAEANINTIVTRDGEERAIEWHDTPLAISDEEAPGLLCTGLDVTERLVLEREILQISAEEQRRIGSDLHDGVCQQLTGLGMLAQGLADVLSRLSVTPASETTGLPDLFDVAKRLSEGIGKTTAQARHLSHGLTPVEVDGQGLMCALRELASSVDTLEGISCRFECQTPVEIGNNVVATHLYRIAQEAIGNALKHSQAHRIRISLDAPDNNRVVLYVADNGIGISDKSYSSGGMGLRIMKYRADLIGATLAVESNGASGTRILCRWSTREVVPMVAGIQTEGDKS